MKPMQEAELDGKRVLLRLDLDVPIDKGHGHIRSSFRIRQILPTLHYLLEHNARVIILSHLGRPGGHYVPEDSLKPVAWQLGNLLMRRVRMTNDVLTVKVRRVAARLSPGQIYMLGNLRFVPEEERNDERFAEELAKLGDIYINDAFAVDHRAHASVAALPKFLPSYAGLCLQDEVKALSPLLKNAPRPYMAVIGGAKLEDKVALLEHLLPLADKVLLGGGVANTFLAASGEPVSLSLIEPALLGLAQKLLKKYGDKLELPFDFRVDYPSPNTFRILDIGPLSLGHYLADMGKAKTIFWTGNLGYTEDPRFAGASQTLTRYLAGRGEKAKTVVSGGDTVGFVDELGLTKKMGFASTGGGSTLAYLAGQPLPGIEALETKKPA